jgi:alpha-galactosidase
MPSSYLNKEQEADTLEIYAVDKVTGVKATLYYTVFAEHGVMTRSVKIENQSEYPVKLERAFSLCVDLPSMDYDLITLYG